MVCTVQQEREIQGVILSCCANTHATVFRTEIADCDFQNEIIHIHKAYFTLWNIYDYLTNLHSNKCNSHIE